MTQHDSTPTPRTIARLVLTILFAGSLLLPAIAGAGVLAQPDTATADLVVEQPHYIESDVEQQSADGTPVYVAQGSILDLHPRNFDPDHVVSFGVTTENGSLTYNEATREFQFEPGAQGTYNVFWVVDQPADTAPATMNQSNTTTAAAGSGVQQRYEAQIRVTGGLTLVHREPGALENAETAAENWREFNSTIHEQGLVGAAGTEAAVEEMINWYDLRKNPVEALSGNIVAYIIIGLTSTAVLLWVLFFGWHVKVVNTLRRKLNIHEAVEAEEGAAKEAVAELDRKENQRVLQNTDWQDLAGFDDNFAKAFREMFATTVHDGTVEYLSAMNPRNLVDDRLRAMGQDGWVAVATETHEPDDGHPNTDTDTATPVVERLETVELERSRDVDDDATVIELADADPETIAAVRAALDAWDCEPIQRFDLAAADYDASELDVTYDSMALEELRDTLHADMRYFEDEQAFGEYLQEFLEAVENSPVCDDHGRVDGIRWTMSHFLKHAQVLDDGFGFPTIRMHRQAIERALIDFDPEQEATAVIDRVQNDGGV